MTVTMSVPEELDVSKLVILHYNEDGTYEYLTVRENSGSTISFTVTHFSIFAFMDEDAYEGGSDDEGDDTDDADDTDDTDDGDDTEDADDTEDTKKTDDTEDTSDVLAVTGLSWSDERKGMAVFNNPNEGTVVMSLVLYQDGVELWGWEGHVEEKGEVTVATNTAIFKSAAYTYNVETFAYNEKTGVDYSTSAKSDFSPEYVYTRPSAQIGTAQNITWSSAYSVSWDSVEHAYCYGSYVYQKAEDDTSYNRIYGVGGITDTSVDYGGDVVNDGQYYVSIRAYSENIEEYANGNESDFVSYDGTIILREDEDEDSDTADDGEETVIDPTDLKNAAVTLSASYLNVKKNNAAQKPTPKKVTLNGKTLKKNRDYTVSYRDESGNSVSALTAVGTYYMVLTAAGSTYKGSQSLKIVVTDKKLMSSVKVTVNKVDYTGTAITSGVIKTVKSGRTELTEGVDYTAAYTNNTDSGKGTLTLTATDSSEFAGTKEVTFEIVGQKLSKAKVTGLSAVDFNGTGGLTQDMSKVTLTYNGSKLTENTDFTVSYEKNDKAGTAKIIFTGKGLYNGTLKKSFKINKVQLNESMLATKEITGSYDSKGAAKPDVSLSYNGVTLVNGTDYTISYKNNKKTSKKTPTLTIKGKGSYAGQLKDIEFTITGN